MRQAAALPLVTIIAWEGLVDRAHVHSGQTVLIHAGTGGVGYAAVQIALAYGAKVFATVSDDKRAIIENIGVIAIDRHMPVEEYLALRTSNEGFDIVYDTLGGAVLDASFLAVKRYTGHVVSCLGWDTHSLAPLSSGGYILRCLHSVSVTCGSTTCQSWTDSSPSVKTRRTESTQALAC